MTRRRRLVLLIVLGVLFTISPIPASADSAVTLPGRGDFADLRVTVSQTTDLINQTIKVTWTGGKPTGPAGNFGMNYLQVMQCWSDDPTGPSREQCEFGGLLTQSSPSAGDFVRLRQVSYGSSLIDPAETIKPQPGQQAIVPFKSVTGKSTTSSGEFFDAGTTNEVPLAKTRQDGGGEVDFEVQTALESYGLGCGGAAKHCWLVVVPRGNKEVDSSLVPGEKRNWLVSSPLSASNWVNHISFPLSFQPVGRACPIGAAERETSGQEFVADAVLRWQPKLCAGGGAVFGYTQVSDNTARDTLRSDKPGLAFLTDPLPDPDRPVVYAPVALSGLAIAFITERASAGEGVVPPEIWQQDGQQISQMKLTPRLVAKLLTQSYQVSLPLRADYLRTNPDYLTRDPDFIALNPDFKDFGVLMSTVDTMVSTVPMDANIALWTWMNGDKDARDFLDGKPDPWKMVVNPNYQGLKLPLPDFPKGDLTCANPGTLVENCALTLRPLSGDMHEAGRSISRGDTLGKAPTGFATPDGKPQLKAVDRQPQGQRSLLAIVNTGTAVRYGLPMAQLRNAGGDFVAPTNDTIMAGLDAMKHSTVAPEVLQTDPLTKLKNAYPLTVMSYAAVVPSKIDKSAGADYANLLRYAVGDGQTVGIQPGQLPEGYTPLPNTFRDQTRAAATKIADTAGIPYSPPVPPPPAVQPGGGDAVPTPPASAQSPASAAAAAAPAAPPPPPPSAAPVSGAPVPVAEARPTPSAPVGIVRYALAAFLVLGAVAAGCGPLLLRLSARQRR
ncbi:hypothetical protein [Actinocrispum wychmicini]|uniref:PBP domain-containing protein n=1 Tax=Actinocrispum wychmicini TaxID=1213861 RepID=A0A4R2JYF7_9PSEU|nr:hypothetical protein [Actinocrispum wychmicini]TCO62426.1 hypothetical protein EV192_102564 [Actinocrispum wychmicini]